MNQQPNSTTLVRAAINVFIAVAIGVSLFQEFSFLSEKPVDNTDSASESKPAEVNVNGTKVDGLVILSTDKFKRNFT